MLRLPTTLLRLGSAQRAGIRAMLNQTVCQRQVSRAQFSTTTTALSANEGAKESDATSSVKDRASSPKKGVETSTDNDGAQAETGDPSEQVELWNKDAPAGPEWRGPRGYEPTRHGDWSHKGRVSDF